MLKKNFKGHEIIFFAKNDHLYEIYEMSMSYNEKDVCVVKILLWNLLKKKLASL